MKFLLDLEDGQKVEIRFKLLTQEEAKINKNKSKKRSKNFLMYMMLREIEQIQKYLYLLIRVQTNTRSWMN